MSTVAVPVAALVAGAVVTVLALLIAFLSRRARRAGIDRLAAAVTRLDTRAHHHDAKRVEVLLDELEQAVDHAVSERTEHRLDTARWTTLFDGVPQALLIADEAGVVVGRNRVAAELIESDHRDEHVAAAVHSLLARAVHGEPAHTLVEQHGPPRKVMRVQAVPISVSGGGAAVAGGAVVIVDDVSERHRLEAMRRDFVADISAELKTPVDAISVLAETIVSEDDIDIVGRLSARMMTEAAKVSRAIEDLLTLTRIEAEESPRRESVALTRLASEAVDRIRPFAEHRRVTVDIAAGDRNLALVCDRRQVVSALFHLLENAVKYSQPGSRVEVAFGTDGGALSLSVRDSGLGVPGDDLERIFERFYRVDRGRSHDTGGTGLGLAIVRHVVSNHAGEVRVESLEGAGSTFTLRFPSGSMPPRTAGVATSVV